MKLNRRQLIGGAAVMAAMPGIPSAFATVKEETRDLVIVGGGLGGLSAANAAVNKGYKALARILNETFRKPRSIVQTIKPPKSAEEFGGFR